MAEKPSIHWDHVAELYDTYVQATFDLPFLLGEAKKTQGPVLELMCGTGRVSVPLAAAGVRLTCVDNAPEMLARLKEKLTLGGLQADVHQMDVRNLDLPQRFDLALIPFHSLSELTSADDQGRTLARIHAHLTDSGRLICTLYNPPLRLKAVDGAMRLWGNFPLSGGDGKLLLWGSEALDPETGIVKGVQVFETYDAAGWMQSRRLLEIRFRMLSRSAFERLAGDCGFAVDALYGDYAYGAFHEETSRHMNYVLRKKCAN